MAFKGKLFSKSKMCCPMQEVLLLCGSQIGVLSTHCGEESVGAMGKKRQVICTGPMLAFKDKLFILVDFITNI